ncbi:hypothetical protein VE04_02688 [Pseudogymnoascus sp. 24MN13]|uniref:Uncharacterized protein n=1 Tax=Pseudogymnoascus verrucosus TaxID=342668 RepID=A0A1B8GWC6_9PEZI|nr:uncharacterized protein VE01_01932 [Pseudogymnoascus verrucosus]OBT56229.1 hypothetical protein VE04_02688 [Pseudogymnoascus sp. 24MN13]OBU00130.1 hypothetical protein VE01_01932 [Pseudogymnoascus verrucosus]
MFKFSPIPKQANGPKNSKSEKAESKYVTDDQNKPAREADTAIHLDLDGGGRIKVFGWVLDSLVLLELSALRSSHGNIDEAVALTAGPPVNPMPEILDMNPEERDVETAPTPELASN